MTRIRPLKRDTARLLSWNVNGLRATYRKGFADTLKNSAADIFALQETRVHADQIDESLLKTSIYSSVLAEAEKKGYSGVGTFFKTEPDETFIGLGVEKFDNEARFVLTRHGKIWVANGYFPNGSGKNRDLSRIPFKLEFYEEVLKRLKPLHDDGEAIFVVGDFNTAHEEIDIARPKGNKNSSGFLQIERDSFTSFLDHGYADTFRDRCKEPDHYSWWSQRSGCRDRNVGWRIDYILASPEADKLVSDAYILPNVLGSDHCPIGVDFSKDALVK